MKGIYTFKKAAEVFGLSYPTLRAYAMGTKTSAPLFFWSEANNDSGCWLVSEDGLKRLFEKKDIDAMPKERYDRYKMGITWGKVIRGRVGEYTATLLGRRCSKYTEAECYQQAREELMELIDTSKNWGRLVMTDNLALGAFEHGLLNGPMAKDIMEDVADEIE